MPISLECWGNGWVWHNCEGISVPGSKVRKVNLVPYTKHAVRLTWATIGHKKSRRRSKATLIQQPSMHKEDMNEYLNNQVGLTKTRLVLARLSSDATILVDDVDPDQVYKITMAPERGGNVSSIFFKVNDFHESNNSGSIRPHMIGGNFLVRTEEVALVVIILALWIVAIALFVHRWGKIRMLEPYQPDYKAIHQPNCPLNQSTSPTHGPPPLTITPRGRAPTFRVLPRKSSSLCFTPSMLRTPHVSSNWKVSAPRLDSQTLKGLSPATRLALQRLRGRLGSDAHAYHYAAHSEVWRKARSAENLRHIRVNISPGRSEDGATTHGRRRSEEPEVIRDLKSSSFDNCKGMKQSVLLDVVARGMSLDSASASIRRTSALTSAWSSGMGSSCPYPEGRTTPEIRISPTPPETHLTHPYSLNRSGDPSISHTHQCPHSRPPGLQRQETVDEAILPSAYATLHEVENETDDSTIPKLERVRMTSKPLLRSVIVASAAKIPKRGTLKKEKVVQGGGSDEAQDTEV